MLLPSCHNSNSASSPPKQLFLSFPFARDKWYRTPPEETYNLLALIPPPSPEKKASCSLAPFLCYVYICIHFLVCMLYLFLFILTIPGSTLSSLHLWVLDTKPCGGPGLLLIFSEGKSDQSRGGGWGANIGCVDGLEFSTMRPLGLSGWRYCCRFLRSAHNIINGLFLSM